MIASAAAHDISNRASMDRGSRSERMVSNSLLPATPVGVS